MWQSHVAAAKVRQLTKMCIQGERVDCVSASTECWCACSMTMRALKLFTEFDVLSSEDLGHACKAFHDPHREAQQWSALVQNFSSSQVECIAGSTNLL